MHNYGDSYKAVFPAGSRTTVYNTWVHFIMPYVEMQAAYAQWNPDQRYTQNPNIHGVHNSLPFTAYAGITRLSMHTCPSDKQATYASWNHYNYMTCAGNTGTYAMYAATHANKDAFGRAWVPRLPDGVISGTSETKYVKHRGACFAMVRGPWEGSTVDVAYGYPSGSNVAFGEINDGMSNTICMSESKQGSVGTDLRGRVTFGFGAIFTTFLAPNSSSGDVMSGANYCSMDDPTFPCYSAAGYKQDTSNENYPSTASNYAYRGARSNHTGGVNVSMADGSVHFASDTINIDTWRELSTTRGGESASF